jgi:phospholipid/cholesterol/gamma-HCH transport system substrate-binding protein
VSRSLSRLQAVVLGLAVLLGLGLGAGALFAIGNRAWYGKDAFPLRAGFPEVKGVEVGTRVRIQGIDAGEVVRVEPPDEPGGLVVLHLKLKGEYRHLVRANSAVQIVSEGLIGGRVLEILPGRPGPEALPVADNDLLRCNQAPELADVLGEAGRTLEDVRAGKGSIGKLVSDPQAHDELVALLREGRQAVASLQQTAASIQRVAEAADRLPLVGGYVENPVTLLERPRCSRDRHVFAAADLFDSGSAVLTAAGKRRLDEIAPWLEAMKHPGSEVVVVAYADPKGGQAEVARRLTREQSEAVCEYLKSRHKVQKMGWFSSRAVTPLGQGSSPPPTPEPKPLPPARVEVVVFVPQK